MNPRPLALALAAALAVTSGALLTGARADPPPYPTGTFTENTTAYMRTISGAPHPTANVNVTVTALSEGAFVDAIDPGTRTEGHGTFPWANAVDYGHESPDVFRLVYDELGTFTPRVFVTDQDDRTTLITLAPITVVLDTTPPTGDVTLPDPALRDRITSWTTVRGHDVDPETGVWFIKPSLMQRRHGVWWVYSSWNERWRKGTRSETWTRAHVITANRQASKTGGTTWAQDVKGLTAGLLVLRVRLIGGNGTDVDLPEVRQYLRPQGVLRP